MPQNIGNHGLYCPQFDDYAAVALYMQDLGTRIDEQLAAQLSALAGFLTRPTMILTNAVNKTIPAGSFNETIFDTVVFDNSAVLTFDATASVIEVGSLTDPYPAGAWTVGGCTRMTAAGAVDVFSSRRFSISVIDNNLPAGSGIITSSSDETFDNNTGGNEAQLVHTSFVLAESGSNTEIRHIASSDNVASATTVLAGSFLWVTFNGPADIIEVA